MAERFNTYLKKSPWLRTILIIAALLVLGTVFIWGIFSNFGLLLARSTPFPVPIHSSDQADYGKDPDNLNIPPMDIQLVVDTIWDLNLSAPNLSLRLTQVYDNFLSTVASITPRPTATFTATIDPDPETTPDGYTTTPGEPAYTLDLTPTTSPTITPPGFIASLTPTEKVIVPTDTPQLPTSTALPPTNTVSPCGQLSLGNFAASTKKASWTVSNNSPSTVTISRISISWPAANSDLTKIFFGQAKIWESTASPPSKTIDFDPGSDLNLFGSSSKIIDFFFLDQSTPTGYNLSINFTNGCSVSKSN